MHPDFSILICFLPLGVMMLSDLRRRRIGVCWLVLFALSLFIFAWIYSGIGVFTDHLLPNLLFLTFLFLVLGIYIRVLRRRVFHSFSRAIGSGDILFLYALSPFFEVREFVLFLTGAFLFSLVAYGTYRLLRKNNPVSTIPLVSSIGLCFMIYASLKLWQ